MHSFIEKIGILTLIVFSQSAFSFPHVRRQVSASSCNDDTRAFALDLQNIITTQTQEITTTTQMISTVSSINFDQGVFEVQQSQLVTEIKETLTVMQTSQSIQIGIDGVSTSLTKLTEMQSTHLTVVQQLDSSSINTVSAKQSLDKLSVSLKSCIQQSQQVLQQTLSICPDISGIEKNQQQGIDADDKRKDDFKKNDIKKDDIEKDDIKKDDNKNLRL